MDFCCSVFINGVGQMHSWGLLLNFASSVKRIQVNKLLHCVKSVQIWSYFWSVFSCIRTEYRKIRTRNNSVFGHFSRSAIPPEIVSFLIISGGVVVV